MKFEIGQLVVAKPINNGGVVQRGWWGRYDIDAAIFKGTNSVPPWLSNELEDLFFIVLLQQEVAGENLYLVYCQNTCLSYISFEKELHEV